jgi:hypothetical protein
MREAKQVLKRLEESNVDFTLRGLTGGLMPITTEDTLEILKNGKGAFLARRFGVSPERYRLWEDFVSVETHRRRIGRPRGTS